MGRNKKQAVTKKEKFNWLSSILVLVVCVGLAVGWVNLRGVGILPKDMAWLGVGVVSFVWMMVALRLVDTTKHSLVIPYAPIFLVFFVTLILTRSKFISKEEFLNISIFFLVGYIGLVPLLSMLGKLTGKDLFFVKR